ARSSSLVYFLGRIFRETHHAPVMENWGGLWMWHAVTILLLCAVTNALFIAGVRAHLPYLLLWSVGLVAWGLFFWHWRRRAGPVVFVERQMAHAWAGGVIASIGTFIVEMMLAQRLELQVLTLTPILAVAAGIVFLVMAGTLSGWFYVAAALCFLAVFPMWLLPDFAPLLLGAASFIGFFVPGLRYYRRKYADATGEDVKKPVK
ncbi:MAG TPA: serine/threonine protein kinase, partial [Terriglobia bacterium]|nr:serine/threonine protein kinase [Terriglobia bacterium]